LELATGGASSAGASSLAGVAGKTSGAGSVASAGNAGNVAGGANPGTATGGAATGGVGPGGNAGEAGAGGEVAEPCSGDGSLEVCNGIDDDCDGDIDEGWPLSVVEAPVVARLDEGATDVGSNVSCISCSWAWEPQLIESGSGIGVVWYLGIYGGKEQPSSFFRALSPELEAQSEVGSLGPEYWMGSLVRGGTDRRGSFLTLVERVAGADVPSFAFIDRNLKAHDSVALPGCGQPGYSFTLSPLTASLVSCGSSGTLHLFAIDAAAGKVLATHEQDLLLAGETMTDIGGRAVAAMHGDQGLVVTPIHHGLNRAAELVTIEISAGGEPLAAPRRQMVDVPTGLELEGLFAVDGGYLLFGHNRDVPSWPMGRFVAPLGFDGEPRGGAAHYDENELAEWDDVAVLQLGDGFVIVTSSEQRGLIVIQLDSLGSVLSKWHQDVPAYSPPSLLYSRGHLYVAYAESPALDDAPNRVLVSRFSCKRPD
jgi:hypothetical protein